MSDCGDDCGGGDSGGGDYGGGDSGGHTVSGSCGDNHHGGHYGGNTVGGSCGDNHHGGHSGGNTESRSYGHDCHGNEGGGDIRGDAAYGDYLHHRPDVFFDDQNTYTTNRTYTSSRFPYDRSTQRAVENGLSYCCSVIKYTVVFTIIGMCVIGLILFLNFTLRSS